MRIFLSYIATELLSLMKRTSGAIQNAALVDVEIDLNRDNTH